MNSPNFTVAFQEAHAQPEKLSPKNAIMKKVVAGIFILFIVLLVFMGKSLISEIGFLVVVILIGLAVWYMGKSKKTAVPDTVEIRFYDQQMVIYKPKYNLTESIELEEIETFPYDGIQECKYSTGSEMLTILGKGKLLQYRYKADGTKEDKPYKEKEMDNLIDQIWLHFALKDDIPGVIEANSPIKVIRTDKFLA